MSETLAVLRRKIDGAGELQSVVRTMKALAASSIGQYERAVAALADYYRTVELGLIACFGNDGPAAASAKPNHGKNRAIGAVVFGSDQGLVGQFNEQIAEFVRATLADIPGKKTVWAVGERIHARLADIGLPPASRFVVPNSVTAITPLVSQLLLGGGSGQWPAAGEESADRWPQTTVFIFHNQLRSKAVCEPVCRRLLPLDEEWRRDLAKKHWPSRTVPEVFHNGSVLPVLVREYLFVSLFRACAESLAGENSSRLAAMQRAEKNIDELLENLTQSFHRLRQSSIDEELFDVISGYESLTKELE